MEYIQIANSRFLVKNSRVAPQKCSR